MAFSRPAPSSAPASNGLKPKAPVEVKSDPKNETKIAAPAPAVKPVAPTAPAAGAKPGAASIAGKPGAAGTAAPAPGRTGGAPGGALHPTPTKEKLAAMTQAVSQIEKTFGKG